MLFLEMVPLLSLPLGCFLLCGLHSQAGPLPVVPTFRLTCHQLSQLGVGREFLFNISGKAQGLVLIGLLRSRAPLWAQHRTLMSQAMVTCSCLELGKHVRPLTLKLRVWEVWFPKEVRGTVIRRKRSGCWAVRMINVCSRRSKSAIIPSVSGYAEKPAFSGTNGCNENGQNLPGNQSNDTSEA